MSNDGRKVWAPVSFLIKVMHRKVIHVIFAGPGFVEIRKFCCHGNVTQRFLLSIKRGEGLGLNFVIKSFELAVLFTGMREQSILLRKHDSTYEKRLREIQSTK